MMARFREAGFARYEISNFAKKGYACRHNLKYWRGEEYVGLGVAAHSCFQGVRYGNTASIENYLSKVAAGVSATVQREAAEPVTEALMLKTRLVEGIPLGELPRGRRAGSFLQKLLQTGYARVQDGAFCLTDHGMRPAQQHRGRAFGIRGASAGRKFFGWKLWAKALRIPLVQGIIGHIEKTKEDFL